MFKTLKKLTAGFMASMLLMSSLAIATPLHAATGNGTAIIRTDNAFGSYSVLDANDLIVGTGQGNSGKTHALPTADEGSEYTIVFGGLNGFNTPADYTFTLHTDETVSYVGEYFIASQAPEQPAVTNGTAILRTDNAFGSYTVLDENDLVVGNGQGNSGKTHALPAKEEGTEYTVVFGEVNGFDKPADYTFTLSAGETVSYVGVYLVSNTSQPAITNGTAILRTDNAFGSYNILDEDDLVVGFGQGNSEKTHPLPTKEEETEYTVVFGKVNGFDKPADYTFTLSAGETVSYVGQYVITGGPSANGTVTVRTDNAFGSYNILDEDDLVVGSGQGNTEKTHPLPSDADGINYRIVYGAVNGFNTPATVEFTLMPNDELSYVGEYTVNGSSDTTAPTLAEVTAVSTPANDSTPEYTFSSSEAGTITYGGSCSSATTAAVAGNNAITFNTLANGTYTDCTITVTDAAGNASLPLAVTEFTVNTGGSSGDTTAPTLAEVTAVSTPANDSTPEYTFSSSEAGTITYGGSCSSATTAAVAGNNAITFNTLANGTYTDCTITVTDAAGNASLPLAVTEFTVAPEALIHISKTAIEASAANNNKRVTYRITVERNSDEGGDVTVRLSDTITGTGALQSGGSGQMNFVPSTYKCEGNSSCTNSAALGIATQPTEIILESSANYSTVIYEMLSNNSAQTVAESFMNTATAIYTDPVSGETVTIHSDPVSVAVSAPPTSTNPSDNTGGGGSGGGMSIFKGDFPINVNKFVSVDGVNYKDASKESLAIVVPENRTTRLYFKVQITNPNDISARDIQYKHLFDTGNSDMTSGEMEDLKGAELNNKGFAEVKKVNANTTYEFSYSLLVHENGQNSNPAVDSLELIDYHSGTIAAYDGHKYISISDMEQSYIFAGRVPAALIRSNSGNGSDVLKINVSTDRSSARIGEVVNYTITVKNITDDDLTNLYLTHSYPGELAIENTGGGVDDGRELTWRRAIVRPGETATYQFSAKVTSGQAGSRVRSITQAMVNEFENITPAESFLTIAGGVAQGGTNYRLAQTGPMTTLLLLIASILSYFGYGAYQKRRYQTIKAEALKF